MWSIGIGRSTINVIYPTLNHAYRNSVGGDTYVRPATRHFVCDHDGYHS